MLRINLLGSFQVFTSGDACAPFEADSARVLLAYIAHHPEVAHRRETLAALLWPEQDDATSLHNLRNALSRVRNAIGDKAASPPYLNIDAKTIQINPQGLAQVDTVEFTRLLARWEAHPHRRLAGCDYCLHLLEAASALYRGDFLAGVHLNSAPFEEWHRMQQESYHVHIQQVWHALAEIYLSRGAYRQAIAVAARQLAHDPWLEEAHQHLMHALALDGQRSAALAQFRACEKTLQAELGVAPAPETVHLFQHIQHGRLSPAAGSPVTLPGFHAPFFGREAELEEAVEILNQPQARLLTLLGPGGVGKTRLSVEIAARLRYAFADGVRFVSLAGLAPEPEKEAAEMRLLQAILQALGVDLSGQRSPRQALWNYLRQKELLLVLDNFEHLLAGVGLVAELLQAGPCCAVLATSRSRLCLQAEQTYPLAGLPFPQPPDGNPPAAPSLSPSVALFMERAARVGLRQPFDDETLGAIGELCRLLQGVPLAIELAASLVAHTPLAQIQHAIQKDFHLLKTDLSDAPARHESLRAVFQHSWDLLSPQQRRLLAQCTVFAGGFTPEAAQAILQVPAAGFHDLAGWSLLQWENARFDLHLAIREFAGEQLESGDLVRSNHAAYYLTLLAGQKEALISKQAPQAVAQIGLDFDNIRRAWVNALRAGLHSLLAPAAETLARYNRFCWIAPEMEDMLRLALAEPGLLAVIKVQLQLTLGQLLISLNRYDEAQRLAAEVAGSLEAGGAPAGQTDLALLYADLDYRRGVFDACLLSAEKALALARQHGLERRECSAVYLKAQAYLQMKQAREAELAARQGIELAHQVGNLVLEGSFWNILAGVCSQDRQVGEARQAFNQALHLKQSIGDRRGENVCLNGLGLLELDAGNFEEAHACFVQNLAFEQKTGDRWYISITLGNLGLTSLNLRLFAQAQDYFERSLETCRETQDRHGEGIARGNLGDVAFCQGDYLAARAHYRNGLEIRENLRDQAGVMWMSCSLALVSLALREYHPAQRFAECALAIHEALPQPRRAAYAWSYFGEARLALGDAAGAQAAFERTVQIRQEFQQPHLLLFPYTRLGKIALLRGDRAAARDYALQLLPRLKTAPLGDIRHSGEAALYCYEVLRSQEAKQVLQSAAAGLQAAAQNIAAPDVRELYLGHIPAHRKIIDLVGGTRNL